MLRDGATESINVMQEDEHTALNDRAEVEKPRRNIIKSGSLSVS